MADESTSARIERWRVLRSSSPRAPSPEMFEILPTLNAAEIQHAAEIAGDDEARVRWWAEIANHPARDALARLRPTQIPIYREICKAGPLTDDELVERLGIKKSSVSPRRKDLENAGLIHVVERRATVSGRTAAAWGAVPADQIEEAQSTANTKGPRRRKLTDYPLEQRVAYARTLVRMDDVNAVLSEDERRSKVGDRARRHARAVMNERDRARREYNERIRQAERDASPRLIFLKALAQLRRATDSVHEIALVIGENIDSQLLFGSSDIPADDWPQVREELHRLIGSATGADGQITRLLGDPDVIDAEWWEVEHLELDSGDT